MWLALFIQFAPMLIGPAVTALVKLAAPKIPKPYLVPIASIIGAGSDQILSLANGVEHSAAQSAAIGMAGIALREAVNQMKNWSVDAGGPKE